MQEKYLNSTNIEQQNTGAAPQATSLLYNELENHVSETLNKEPEITTEIRTQATQSLKNKLENYVSKTANKKKEELDSHKIATEIRAIVNQEDKELMKKIDLMLENSSKDDITKLYQSIKTTPLNKETVKLAQLDKAFVKDLLPKPSLFKEVTNRVKKAVESLPSPSFCCPRKK
jgi:16S rRNA C1402 (ribose-2'-O) methylase RsmI